MSWLQFQSPASGEVAKMYDEPWAVIVEAFGEEVFDLKLNQEMRSARHNGRLIAVSEPRCDDARNRRYYATIIWQERLHANHKHDDGITEADHA